MPSNAVIKLTCEGITTEIACPAAGEGSYWHVFDYDGTTRLLKIRNILTTEPPIPAQLHLLL